MTLQQNSTPEKPGDGNPYIPSLVTITDITTENDLNDLKTFKLEFKKKADKDNFYKSRGWENDGIPSDKTLRRLKILSE